MEQQDLQQIKEVIDVAVDSALGGERMRKVVDVAIDSALERQQIQKTIDTAIDSALGGERMRKVVDVAIDSALERHLAAVHDDITDLRTELKSDMSDLRTEIKGDITELRTELKADIAAVAAQVQGLQNRVGAIDYRIDDEILARKDLEGRVRTVLPALPHAAISV